MAKLAIAELEKWDRSFLNDQAQQRNIQGIWEQAAHNPDPDKRKLFDALHNYLLDKRQKQTINEKHFVI